MFFGARGKTRSLMTFFDNGCSRFIMRVCIRNKEPPASLIKSGQIPIGGVGATTIFAPGEFLVAMDTIEGKEQGIHISYQCVRCRKVKNEFHPFFT